MKIRLDKYLADMGKGTRTQVKREIARGNVSVNGISVKKPEQKIDTDKDEVVFCHDPVQYREHEYFMLNKPSGVVSATEDAKDRTVIDLIGEKQRKDLFPVGRLDKDTEGLLLITNDGELAHRLLSPRKHVDKVYFARVSGVVTEDDKKAFSEGLDIGEERLTLPAELTILKTCGETPLSSLKRGEAPPEMKGGGEIFSEAGFSEVEVTVREGKFHQVKRMFRAVGKEVVYLKRLRMGSLVLDGALAPGEYRRLKEEEIRKLC